MGPVVSDVFSPLKKNSITMDPKFIKHLDSLGLDNYNSHIVFYLYRFGPI